MDNLLNLVRQKLVDSNQEITSGEIIKVVRKETHGLLNENQLFNQYKKIEQELVGLGKIEYLLQLPNITDILVVGSNEIWIDQGKGLEKTSLQFSNEKEVASLATRLALQNGKRLDAAKPWVDTNINLPNVDYHIRFHAVLASLTRQGTCISLRILRPKEVNLAQLVANQTIDTGIVHFLKQMISRKVSFLISGGTGSGKTTLLNALLQEIPNNERVICVEDTYELVATSKSQINLTTLDANNEGTGEITLSLLIKQALRMRPDRIVVGEVRGAEIVDLLTALNTGHLGSAGTIHANSTAEVPSRVEALGALGGIKRSSMHSLFAAAVKIILHVEKDTAGYRRLKEIGILYRDGDYVKIKKIWKYGSNPPSNNWDHIC